MNPIAIIETASVTRSVVLGALADPLIRTKPATDPVSRRAFQGRRRTRGG